MYLFDNINDQVAAGYPKLISREWPGLPDNLDSAFRWYYDGVSYFFKGDYYYWWDDNKDRVGGLEFIGNTKWKNLCEVE